MTNAIELKQMGLSQLTEIESNETNGGLITLIIAYALQAALVGSLAAGLVASAKAGYNDMQ